MIDLSYVLDEDFLDRKEEKSFLSFITKNQGYAKWINRRSFIVHVPMFLGIDGLNSNKNKVKKENFIKFKNKSYKAVMVKLIANKKQLPMREFIELRKLKTPQLWQMIKSLKIDKDKYESFDRSFERKIIASLKKEGCSVSWTSHNKHLYEFLIKDIEFWSNNNPKIPPHNLHREKYYQRNFFFKGYKRHVKDNYKLNIYKLSLLSIISKKMQEKNPQADFSLQELGNNKHDGDYVDVLNYYSFEENPFHSNVFSRTFVATVNISDLLSYMEGLNES